MRVFLGLGSNLGDRERYLREAIAAMPDVAAVSPIYETEPVGGPEQGPYLNCVVELDTDRTPRQLLEDGADPAADVGEHGHEPGHRGYSCGPGRKLPRESLCVSSP